VTADYSEKGQFVEIAGLKTYKTGPESAKAALILIYDVFGFGPQILQGGDILAHAEGKHSFQVYIPDFLEGSYADPAWFPPEKASVEARQAMGKYFSPGSGPAAADVMMGKLKAVVDALKANASGVEKYGLMGYCWGAKIVSLSTTEGTVFHAAAEVHPSALSPADAPKIVVPIVVLASGDEDGPTVKAFEAALKVPKFVDTYSEAPHGWMTSR
jgi:dienelactone hydrolase